MRGPALVTQGVAFLVSIIAFGSLGQAASAPKEIIGNKIVVSFSETREYRPLVGPDQSWRTITNAFKVQLYVSEAGRIFGRGRIDNSVGSTAGDSIVGSRASLAGNFSGRTLVITSSGASNNYARRMSVEFDPGFKNCTAQVLFARQSNSGITREYNPMRKRMDEVKSNVISGTSCSIQAGNVFADR